MINLSQNSNSPGSLQEEIEQITYISPLIPVIKSKHNEWSFIEKRYYVTLARYTQKVNDCLYLFMVVDVLLLPSLVLHSLCIYFSSKFHSHSDLRWHINPSQVDENGRNSRGFLLHYYTVHLRGKNIIFHESTLCNVCVCACKNIR